MNNQKITVDSTGNINPSELRLGREGEHNFTVLEISLDQNLCTADYFRLTFDGFCSENLVPTANKITYSVPQSALHAGVVILQIDGYKFSADGKTPTLIFKSTPAYCKVLRSLDPKRNLPTEAIVPAETAYTELKKLTDKAEDLRIEVYAKANIAQQSATTAEKCAKTATEKATYCEEIYAQCTPLVQKAQIAEQSALKAEECATQALNYQNASRTYSESSSESANGAKLSEVLAEQSSKSAKTYCEQTEEYATRALNAVKSAENKAEREYVERNFATSKSHAVYTCTPVWTITENEYVSAINKSCRAAKCNCEYGFWDGDYRIFIDCTHSEADEQKSAPRLIVTLTDKKTERVFKSLAYPLAVRWGYAFADICLDGFEINDNGYALQFCVAMANGDIPLTVGGEVAIFENNARTRAFVNTFGDNFTCVKTDLLAKDWQTETDQSGTEIAINCNCDITLLAGKHKAYLLGGIDSIDGTNLPTIQFISAGSVVAEAVLDYYGYNLLGCIDIKTDTKIDNIRLLYAETDPIIISFFDVFDGELIVKADSLPQKANVADVFTKTETENLVTEKINNAIIKALQSEV